MFATSSGVAEAAEQRGGAVLGDERPPRRLDRVVVEGLPGLGLEHPVHALGHRRARAAPR